MYAAAINSVKSGSREQKITVLPGVTLALSRHCESRLRMAA